MRKLKYLFLSAVAFFYVGSIYAENDRASSETTVFQQSEKVAGTISDESGPLIGASVSVKGTSKGSVTDRDGRFLLDVKRGETIVVSFLGYATKEIVYNGESYLSIVLEEDTQKLEEVVVTALGIKRDAKALGYGMTTIAASDIVKTATPNFATSLYGKIPGVRVQAAPGGTSIFAPNDIRK